MASLPEARFRGRDFSIVETDFAGPFLMMQRRGKFQNKPYFLCLFTCFSFRAVHLKMTFGLDTSDPSNGF